MTIKYLGCRMAHCDPAASNVEISCAALNTLKQKMISKQEKLDAEARAKLVPVKHTIKVEPLN